MTEVSDSSVDTFTSTLEALSLVKAPGVSGSKIRKLTEIAVANVQVNICLLITVVYLLNIHLKLTCSFLLTV